MARRSGKGEPSRTRASGGDTDEVLRAKYLDYCSARVCDVFMELDAERIFELAREAESKAGVSFGELSFQELSALLVDVLLGDTALPDFESWAADYRRHPERYDPYLLGLWKATLESHATSR